MNKKFFTKKQSNGYKATFAVVSDVDIVADPEWEEAEEILNPDWTAYQCHNPEMCVKEYMRKQDEVDVLRKQLEETKAERSVFRSLLASKMPIDQPVLFGEIVAVMNEDGVVLFQKAIPSAEL